MPRNEEIIVINLACNKHTTSYDILVHTAFGQ